MESTKIAEIIKTAIAVLPILEANLFYSPLKNGEINVSMPVKVW